MSSAQQRPPKFCRTFVDRGGTFTDVVKVTDDGRVRIQKVPSDEAVVGQLAEGDLVFGTTVATNALLEGKGVSCVLFVTEGFRDFVHIGDMSRPHLFDASIRWPESLATRIEEVPGRVDAQGVEVEPLPAAFLKTLEDWDWEGVESVAIALLNSPRNPAHELQIAQAIPKHIPCALGHLLSPSVDYLARIETAVVDGAITPILQRAIAKDEVGHEELAIRSDGSLCPAGELRAPDAVLSGPAGGVLAVAEVARQAGFSSAVGLDMGGTSTDVCRVDVGNMPRRESGHRVGGQRILRRVLEVETIAAGGGSILANTGTRLTVGPESAGAHPGPACRGRGGPPTLTDAALAVQLVDPAAFDPPLVDSSSEIPGAPEHFLSIAREAMAGAIRRIATARGVDLRDHALVSYGGAAGQHAAEVASLVGIRTVLVHPCASVLSAWGQSLAKREEALEESLWRPLDEVEHRLGEHFAALAQRLPQLGQQQCTVALRYRGSDYPIVLPWVEGEDLRALFRSEHLRLYGFERAEGELEVLRIQVRSVAATGPLAVANEDPFDLGESSREGPCVLHSATTSVWVPKGWNATRRNGLLELRHEGEVEAPRTHERTPEGVALWSMRFMAVAEQAGERLRRLGRSVNIRERLDFSCAVFDGQGRLVANAPHIPVHLGAMGETVRDLLREHPNLDPDQAWLCNDPNAGGSHLPDLTVVQCLVHDGERFFVANRAHHVDVGGLTPGSMPPHSTSLEDEGLVFRHVPLLQGGQLRDLRALLKGCRDKDSVCADLEAQIAANQQAKDGLIALGNGQLIRVWMEHLFEVAKEEVQGLVQVLPEAEVEDCLDGVLLRLKLSQVRGRLQVDFRGTKGPHSGNLNAPRAVVRSAVLYGLRVLMRREFPLNEGALSEVDILLPDRSIVSPSARSAVVGGNVETSQRITDLFLRAAGAQAASQGTMNNLTFGASDWAYYETIGGGSGAGSMGPGVSAVQVHMTNTRGTDPEVLEARLPLRVRQTAFRPGSGGDGLHRGGDGLVREIEVLESCEVSLLATRRSEGASGLHDGGRAKPGVDHVFHQGRWEIWSGELIVLNPGDRIRIQTPGGGGWGCKERGREDLSP